MLVSNPNFRPRDFQIGLHGLGALMDGIGRLGSLGTCQWPQPGVPMVYPSCATDEAYIKAEASTQPAVYTGITSVYDVPGLWQPGSSCLDEGGFVIADSACVEENLRIQQENFRRLAEYNANIATQNQQVSIRNPVSGEVFVNPQPVTPNTPNLVTTTTEQKTSTTAASQDDQKLEILEISKEAFEGLKEKVSGDLNIGGYNIPIWGIGLALVGIYFVTKGGR